MGRAAYQVKKLFWCQEAPSAHHRQPSGRQRRSLWDLWTNEVVPYFTGLTLLKCSRSSQTLRTTPENQDWEGFAHLSKLVLSHFGRRFESLSRELFLSHAMWIPVHSYKKRDGFFPKGETRMRWKDVCREGDCCSLQVRMIPGEELI